jgi:hypothetical protein
MSTVLSLPPIDIAERAAAILAVNAASDRARINSINKASFILVKGAVEIASAFDGVLVTSATRAGTVHRMSALHGCSCEAAASGKACWHSALLEILEESAATRYPAGNGAAGQAHGLAHRRCSQRGLS